MRYNQNLPKSSRGDEVSSSKVYQTGSCRGILWNWSQFVLARLIRTSGKSTPLACTNVKTAVAMSYVSISKSVPLFYLAEG
jgi:hypothetical protein